MYFPQWQPYRPSTRWQGFDATFYLPFRRSYSFRFIEFEHKKYLKNLFKITMVLVSLVILPIMDKFFRWKEEKRSMGGPSFSLRTPFSQFWARELEGKVLTFWVIEGAFFNKIPWDWSHSRALDSDLSVNDAKRNSLDMTSTPYFVKEKHHEVSWQPNIPF